MKPLSKEGLALGSAACIWLWWHAVILQVGGAGAKSYSKLFAALGQGDSEFRSGCMLQKIKLKDFFCTEASAQTMEQ